MKTEIKQDWLKRAKEHAEADRFIKGTWLGDEKDGQFKGCFFGCMTQTEDNTLKQAAQQMNSPMWIVKLAENIFENLPDTESTSFPVDYLKAIPSELSDDDYEQIRHKLAIKRMARMYKLVDAIDTEESYRQECLDAINQVLEYHHNPSESAARSASSAASAARSAASAARSASSAASAAWSAAWSADSASWSAARSAESASSASSAARSAAWSAESAESAARSAAWSAWSAAWSAASFESAESNEYINERDDLFAVFAEFK